MIHKFNKISLESLRISAFQTSHMGGCLSKMNDQCKDWKWIPVRNFSPAVGRWTCSSLLPSSASLGGHPSRTDLMEYYKLLGRRMGSPERSSGEQASSLTLSTFSWKKFKRHLFYWPCNSFARKLVCAMKREHLKGVDILVSKFKLQDKLQMKGKKKVKKHDDEVKFTFESMCRFSLPIRPIKALACFLSSSILNSHSSDFCFFPSKYRIMKFRAKYSFNL